MIVLPTDVQHELRDLLEGGDPEIIAERVRALPNDRVAMLLSALHPADSAEVLEEMEPEQQRAVFAQLEHSDAAEVLAYLDADEQAEVVADLPVEHLADILEVMEPDDAADVLAHLPDGQATAVLSDMEDADAAEVQSLLQYDEESAGGLMTSNVVTLRPTATVAQALDLLRQFQPPEELAYYFYVTDADQHLLGVISLQQLVMTAPSTRLQDIMDRHVVSVPVDTDQEQAAQVLAHYGLLALPAVDANGRLVGIITADDVIDVIQEEATEDMYRLAGMAAAEDVWQPVFTASRQRLTWLLINLPTALLASAVVSLFAGTVQKVAILAAFMPIIAGMGGNAGIQTLTLAVRSIALGELSLRDQWRMLRREALIGLSNGVAFGILIGLIGFMWQGLPVLGLVAAVAMWANMLVAAIMGTLVPLVLRRFGADPALASGVIVTTFTDVTGYGCFLGLATLLINAF